MVPVLLYHAGFAVAPGGYVGVDVFFVISGYLITTILADQLTQGSFSVWQFYERRARRILPVLLLVILTSLPFGWLWLLPRDLASFGDSILAVLSFTSNLFFRNSSGYFQTSADLQPLLHTWSLAVEEQFYIGFPLLLMLVWRRPVVVLAALLAGSLVYAEIALVRDPVAAFFLLPSRGWELLAGALVALYLRKTPLPVLGQIPSAILAAAGIGLIAIAVLSYGETTQFPGMAALPPTLGAALVILFARGGNPVQRALGLRGLVWIGLRSYGAYLWHQPVFALFRHRFGPEAFADAAVPLIVLSFGLAHLGFHLVEQPFRHRLSRRSLLLALAGAAAAAIGAAILVQTQATRWPEETPAYRRVMASEEAQQLLRYVDGHDVRMFCSAEGPQGIQSCAFGDRAAAPTLVLWGDSLAGALLSGMDASAAQLGRGGLAFVANGCPPVPGLANTMLPSCAGTTHDAILSSILSLTGITDVVITGNLSAALVVPNVLIDGGPTSDLAVRAKLADAVAQLRAKGIRVILLEQGPTFDTEVAAYLLQNLRDGQPTTLQIDRAVHDAAIAGAKALGDLVDLYIPTADLFCTDTACPGVDATGQLVIFDRNHVTPEYSARLARLIGQAAGF